jgi:hypothetical protein
MISHVADTATIRVQQFPSPGAMPHGFAWACPSILGRVPEPKIVVLAHCEEAGYYG